MTRGQVTPFRFGEPLDRVPCTYLPDCGNVPQYVTLLPVVVYMVRFLVEAGEIIRGHVDVEGLFRKSGDLRHHAEVKRLAERGEGLLGRLDVHEVTSLVKTFFRLLPEPLLPYLFHDPLLSSMLLAQDRRGPAVQGLCFALPAMHLSCLRYFMALLAHIAAHVHTNRMSPRNLAVVLTPGIIRLKARTKLMSQEELRVLPQQTALVEHLICHADVIGCMTSHMHQHTLKMTEELFWKKLGKRKMKKGKTRVDAEKRVGVARAVLGLVANLHFRPNTCSTVSDTFLVDGPHSHPDKANPNVMDSRHSSPTPPPLPPGREDHASRNQTSHSAPQATRPYTEKAGHKNPSRGPTYRGRKKAAGNQGRKKTSGIQGSDCISMKSPLIKSWSSVIPVLTNILSEGEDSNEALSFIEDWDWSDEDSFYSDGEEQNNQPLDAIAKNAVSPQDATRSEPTETNKPHTQRKNMSNIHRSSRLSSSERMNTTTSTAIISRKQKEPHMPKRTVSNHTANHHVRRSALCEPIHYQQLKESRTTFGLPAFSDDGKPSITKKRRPLGHAEVVHSGTSQSNNILSVPVNDYNKSPASEIHSPIEMNSCIYSHHAKPSSLQEEISADFENQPITDSIKGRKHATIAERLPMGLELANECGNADSVRATETSFLNEPVLPSNKLDVHTASNKADATTQNQLTAEELGSSSTRFHHNQYCSSDKEASVVPRIPSETDTSHYEKSLNAVHRRDFTPEAKSAEEEHIPDPQVLYKTCECVRNSQMCDCSHTANAVIGDCHTTLMNPSSDCSNQYRDVEANDGEVVTQMEVKQFSLAEQLLSTCLRQHANLNGALVEPLAVIPRTQPAGRLKRRLLLSAKKQSMPEQVTHLRESPGDHRQEVSENCQDESDKCMECKLSVSHSIKSNVDHAPSFMETAKESIPNEEPRDSAANHNRTSLFQSGQNLATPIHKRAFPFRQRRLTCAMERPSLSSFERLKHDYNLESSRQRRLSYGMERIPPHILQHIKKEDNCAQSKSRQRRLTCDMIRAPSYHTPYTETDHFLSETQWRQYCHNYPAPDRWSPYPMQPTEVETITEAEFQQQQLSCEMEGLMYNPPHHFQNQSSHQHSLSQISVRRPSHKLQQLHSQRMYDGRNRQRRFTLGLERLPHHPQYFPNDGSAYSRRPEGRFSDTERYPKQSYLPLQKEALPKSSVDRRLSYGFEALRPHIVQVQGSLPDCTQIDDRRRCYADFNQTEAKRNKNMLPLAIPEEQAVEVSENCIQPSVFHSDQIQTADNPFTQFTKQGAAHRTSNWKDESAVYQHDCTGIRKHRESFQNIEVDPNLAREDIEHQDELWIYQNALVNNEPIFSQNMYHNDHTQLTPDEMSHILNGRHQNVSDEGRESSEFALAVDFQQHGGYFNRAFPELQKTSEYAEEIPSTCMELNGTQEYVDEWKNDSFLRDGTKNACSSAWRTSELYPDYDLCAIKHNDSGGESVTAENTWKPGWGYGTRGVKSSERKPNKEFCNSLFLPEQIYGPHFASMSSGNTRTAPGFNSLCAPSPPHDHSVLQCAASEFEYTQPEQPHNQPSMVSDFESLNPEFSDRYNEPIHFTRSKHAHDLRHHLSQAHRSGSQPLPHKLSVRSTVDFVPRAASNGVIDMAVTSKTKRDYRRKENEGLCAVDALADLGVKSEERDFVRSRDDELSGGELTAFRNAGRTAVAVGQGTSTTQVQQTKCPANKLQHQWQETLTEGQDKLGDGQSEPLRLVDEHGVAVDPMMVSMTVSHRKHRRLSSAPGVSKAWTTAPQLNVGEEEAIEELQQQLQMMTIGGGSRNNDEHKATSENCLEGDVVSERIAGYDMLTKPTVPDENYFGKSSVAECVPDLSMPSQCPTLVEDTTHTLPVELGLQNSSTSNINCSNTIFDYQSLETPIVSFLDVCTRNRKHNLDSTKSIHTLQRVVDAEYIQETSSTPVPNSTHDLDSPTVDLLQTGNRIWCLEVGGNCFSVAAAAPSGEYESRAVIQAIPGGHYLDLLAENGAASRTQIAASAPGGEFGARLAPEVSEILPRRACFEPEGDITLK